MTAVRTIAPLPSAGSLRSIGSPTSLPSIGPVAHLADVVSPAPYADWRAAYLRDADAVPSQSPEWLDAMVAAGGWADASRLYRFADGRELVLPLARRTHAPRALSGSWSYGAGNGIGGLVGEGLDAAAIAAVFDDLRRVGGRVCVRPNPLHTELWAAGAPASTTNLRRRAHVIDLRGGVDAVWTERLTKTCRRYVRVAERSGIDIEVGSNPALAGTFHGLLMQSVDRWASAQHEPPALARLRTRQRDPLAKLMAWSRHLGESCRFYVASLGGEPVAASVVLFGANAHETRSAMNKTLAGRTSANYLLGWLSIRDAVERGCRWYHLGDSGRSVGLSHFKEKFGGVACEYAEYRVETLPITALERRVRAMAKRAIGFRDT